MDGDQAITEKDFLAVRGDPGENRFIKGIHQEMIQIESRAAALRAALEKL